VTGSWLFCGFEESVKDSGIGVNLAGFLCDAAKLGIHHQTLEKFNMVINCVHKTEIAYYSGTGLFESRLTLTQH